MLRSLSCITHFATLLLLPLGHTQQFSDLPLPPSWPGISDACFSALNTTVSCPALLNRASINNYPRLGPTDLTSLCVDSCLTSLNNVRSTIQTACTNSTDVIVYNGDTYPATYIADQFIYTYKLSCRRDPATSQFCDTLFISWLNQPSLTSAQNCSDCLLGAGQNQLNSPFGYDADFASDFQLTTSSCGATGYAFTVPASYTLTSSATSATATATATSTPSCATPYTVLTGDSCNSIAQANNVSTFSVISRNGLNPLCDNLAAGASICLSSPCNLYVVQASDTCASIIQAQGNGITGIQLLAWNPDINSLCGNLYNLKGNYICVSPPGGSIGNVVPTSTLAVSTPTSPVPKPTNAPNESNSICGRWYTIQDGDYCDKVSVTFGIALKEFYFLNPEINSNCTNLLLGLAYCVQAVGSIETYSGYSTSHYFSLTSATYSTTTTSSVTDYPAPIYTSEAQLPLASGSLTNCAVNRNYHVVPPIVDQSQSTDISLFTDYINSCAYLAGTYGVDIPSLLSWNPSLTADNCTMLVGKSYCVNLNQPTNGTAVVASDCSTVDTIHTGTISSCSCFTTVFGYDNGSYPCAGVATDFSITVDQLITWNPWVGSNCDLGLYAGLGPNDQNAVCVGVNSTEPTASATSGPSTTTSAGATAAPTQTGIVSTCTTYYTARSGDTCSGIAAMYTITFDQFYAWNPAVGSTCASLWVGYGYCVSAPSTTSTTAATAVTTSAALGPTRSGTPADCTTYYTVQSGDSCQKIQSAFNITFSQLYTWNPSIGSNCESLWVGYSVCVAKTT